MNRNLGLSAGVLALMALVFHVSSPTGPEQTFREQSAAGEKKPGTAKKKSVPGEKGAPPTPPIEGPWLATRSFFGTHVVPKTEAGASVPALDLENLSDIEDCSNQKDCSLRLQNHFWIDTRYDIQFLLATVPDPLHTRLAMATDSTIQAIQTAASATGWTFATQWLPWNDTTDPDEGDPAKRREQRTEIRQQEQQPGLLVFRPPAENGSWPARVLLIFLVGETPTAGVNSTQFRIARAYMRAIHEPSGVRLVGPRFSGSFYSLSKLIERDRSFHKDPDSLHYTLRGTATSPIDESAFRNTPGVSFYGEIQNVEQVRMGFSDTLQSLGVEPEQAAMLVEDETTFGYAVDRSNIGNRQPIRVFRFPRDIAHLRNAYREVAQASKSDKATTPDLDFSLKDPNLGEDSTPTFSNTQSPLEQNAVVNEIAGAIRRERVRVVELVATNVLDLIFLARVLRQQCPDTRILLSNADRLLVEAAQKDPLNGILVLSTYPMFFESNRWMTDKQKIMPATFSDAVSEGIYNATVRLLAGGSDWRKEVTDYRWRSLRHPPTWLLTLDRRGFLPVHVWENPQKYPWFEETNALEQHLDLPPPPRIWKFISNSAILASIAFTGWIIFLSLRPKLLLDARLAIAKDSEGGRMLYLFLSLLILSGMLTVICMPRWRDAPDATWVSNSLTGLGCGLPATLALFLLIAYLVRPGKGGIAMLLAAVPVVAGLWLWYEACFGEGIRGLFFRFRSVELHFGSSPAWPILAAGGALFIFCFLQLTRLYFVSHQEPEVIAADLDTVLKEPLTKYYEEFIQSSHSLLGFWKPERWFWFFGLGGAFAVLCYLCGAHVHLRSIDGDYYNWLSITLQLTVIATLFLVCWQVRDLWHFLKSFSGSINTMPLRDSFCRTDGSRSRQPIWVRRLNLQSLEVHVKAAIVLHDMMLLPPEASVGTIVKNELKDSAIKYQYGIRKLLNVRSERTREDVRELHQILGGFGKDVAKKLFDEILMTSWRSELLIREPHNGSAGKDHDPEEQLVDVHGDPRNIIDLAQTFVALHFSAFLLYGVRQIQTLMLYLPLGFVLLMISMSSYSPQSPQLIGRFLLILFAVIGFLVYRCLSEIERNPILSRIAGTEPGELGGDFFLKLLGFGGLPVLGILAQVFPSISSFLFSWVEPTIEGLH